MLIENGNDQAVAAAAVIALPLVTAIIHTHTLAQTRDSRQESGGGVCTDTHTVHLHQCTQAL